jgi:hypothetical protein
MKHKNHNGILKLTAMLLAASALLFMPRHARAQSPVYALRVDANGNLLAPTNFFLTNAQMIITALGQFGGTNTNGFTATAYLPPTNFLQVPNNLADVTNATLALSNIQGAPLTQNQNIALVPIFNNILSNAGIIKVFGLPDSYIDVPASGIYSGSVHSSVFYAMMSKLKNTFGDAGSGNVPLLFDGTIIGNVGNSSQGSLNSSAWPLVTNFVQKVAIITSGSNPATAQQVNQFTAPSVIWANQMGFRFMQWTNAGTVVITHTNTYVTEQWTVTIPTNMGKVLYTNFTSIPGTNNYVSISSSTGTNIVMMVEMANNRLPGVEDFNWSYGGTDTAQWFATDTNFSDHINGSSLSNMIAGINPNLVLYASRHQLGGDSDANATITTNNIYNMLSYCKTSPTNVVVDLSEWPANDGSLLQYLTTVSNDQMMASIISKLEQNLPSFGSNYIQVDFLSRFTNEVALQMMGVLLDSIHSSYGGAEVLANEAFRQLGIPVEQTVGMTQDVPVWGQGTARYIGGRFNSWEPLVPFNSSLTNATTYLDAQALVVLGNGHAGGGVTNVDSWTSLGDGATWFNAGNSSTFWKTRSIIACGHPAVILTNGSGAYGGFISGKTISSFVDSTNNTDSTMIIVGSFAQSGAQNQIMSWGGGSSTVYQAKIGDNSSSEGVWWEVGTDRLQLAQPPGAGGLQLYRFWRLGTNMQIVVNGATSTPGMFTNMVASTALVANSTQNAAIGNDFLMGSIGHIIIWPRALQPWELFIAEQNLANYYGITLGN